MALGASGLPEPLCGAVPAKRGDVGNDAQVEGLRLDLWRKLAGVHDQAVHLDEPDIEASRVAEAETAARSARSTAGCGADG